MKKDHLHSYIRFSLSQEGDGRFREEVASETLYFPLLYFNGHGFKDYFYLYSHGTAVAKLLINTSYEAYPKDQLPQ